MQHIIKYVDDVLASAPRELEHEFAPSFDEAWDKADARIPALRVKYGRRVDYIIEDMTGRRTMIGPGRFDDAKGS